MRCKVLIAVGILLGVGWMSCKKKCTVSCTDTDIGVAVSGYADGDLDTVEVWQYRQQSNFTHLERHTTMYDAMGGLGFLDHNYDWQIFIPATNQTFRLSDIKNLDRKTLSGDCNVTTGCLNGIISFQLNGMSVNADHVTLSK